MRIIKIGLFVLLLTLTVLYIVNLYKWYSWERIDIINMATILTSIIAIAALIFNAKQYSLNKDKRLYELGEFRIEKIYKPKIDRIQRLKIPIVVNDGVDFKGRGFQLEPNSIHIVQHQLIEYLIKTYEKEIGINLIYSPDNTERTDDWYIEFIKVLKAFHDGINNFSPWVLNYHRQYLDLIVEMRNDKNMSNAQRESFISSLLLNELLGYNMIMTGKQTTNFKIVSSIAYSPKLKVTTIGYLDFVKSILPTNEAYLKALGEYKKIFERDLP
jgi:hypothetical protein